MKGLSRYRWFLPLSVLLLACRAVEAPAAPVPPPATPVVIVPQAPDLATAVAAVITSDEATIDPEQQGLLDEAPASDDADVDVALPEVEGEAIPQSPPTSPPPPRQPCPLPRPLRADPLAVQADDAFAKYTDCNQLVELDPGPGINVGAGNGVLYTSEKLAFYAERNWISDDDRRAFVSLIQSIEAAPGLINRNPPKGFHPDQEGVDDYVGLVAAARMIGANKIAHDVWRYGNDHLWSYNNVDPAGSINGHSFINRPWWVAHFSYCAGEPADEIPETAWGAKMALGAAKGDAHAGDVALEWLMIHCLPNNAGATAKAGAALWVHRFKHNWPGGIRDVMAAYFKPHPGHPLVTYAPPMDDFKNFGGVFGILKGIAEMLMNEGAALVKSTIREAKVAVHLAVIAEKDLIAAAAQTAARFRPLADKAAREVVKVDKRLAAAEQRLSAKSVGKVVAAVDHPVEIIVKDAPEVGKAVEHPFVVVVKDAPKDVKELPKDVAHTTIVAIKDLRTWAHQKKCGRVVGKKVCI